MTMNNGEILEVKDGIVVMPPAHRDETTGAVYVHKDYAELIKPHDAAEHIRPINVAERFKNIESWASYITRFGIESDTYITACSSMLHATLDYHDSDTYEPGRCQWRAIYTYPFTKVFNMWQEALDSLVPHEAMVMLLDDSLEYVQPTEGSDSAEIFSVISALRVTTQSSGETEIRPDGSTAVKWSRDTTVRGSKDGEARIPAQIRLSLPIIDDRRIDFTVKLRVQIGSEGKVAFSLSSMDFEDAVDGALADEVKAAEDALGGFDVPVLHVV